MRQAVVLRSEFRHGGQNITDEDYRTFGYNLGADLGLPVHQWGNPATYGVDISVSM